MNEAQMRTWGRLAHPTALSEQARIKGPLRDASVVVAADGTATVLLYWGDRIDAVAIDVHGDVVRKTTEML